MTYLPEPHTRQAAPTVRPPYDTVVPQPAQHIVPDARVRIVEYRLYGDVPVPVYERQTPVEATPARDLTPQPLLDPLAQRLLAGGIGGGTLAAGAGWGAGELLGGVAAIPTSSIVLLLALALTLRGAFGRRGGTVVHKTTNVHQHSGLFGRNHNTN